MKVGMKTTRKRKTEGVVKEEEEEELRTSKRIKRNEIYF